MLALVEQAMKDGALGISSALIYPPNIYAKTEELIALAKVASAYGGLYATHMRSEGASETAALEEAIRIGREANIPVEIFHLKVSGKPRWGNMKGLVATIQAARDSGLDIAADMYPYNRWFHRAGVGLAALGRRRRPTETSRAHQRTGHSRGASRENSRATMPTGKTFSFDCGGRDRCADCFGCKIPSSSNGKEKLSTPWQSLEEITGRRLDGFRYR